jgi:hypothetical protein
MELSNVIKAALLAPTPEGSWGLPLLLWGDPGVGKTAIVKALAQRYAFVFERLSPAERGEGQFGCVPVPGDDGALHYPAPDWASKFDTAAGLLFLDEIDKAGRDLQASLLGAVQLRVIGAKTLGPRTRVLGAANYTADGGGHDLVLALRNRFGHLTVEGLASDEWAVALLGGFSSNDDDSIDIDAEEARVLAAHPAAVAKARGLVAGFISRRPDLLHQKPAKGDPALAFPTRRSWEYVVSALASAEIQGLNERERDSFTTAFVGAPAIREFATWVANVDLPNPAAFLDGKATFEHSTRRLDRTLAVLGACAALVVPAEAANRKARAGALWTFIGSLLDEVPDVVVPAARALVNARLTFPTIPQAQKPLAKLLPLIKVSGIGAGK